MRLRCSRCCSGWTTASAVCMPLTFSVWNLSGLHANERVAETCVTSATGQRKLGYDTVTIDAGSLAGRDPVSSKLLVNLDRFPSGLRNLSDTLHVRRVRRATTGQLCGQGRTAACAATTRTPRPLRTTGKSTISRSTSARASLPGSIRSARSRRRCSSRRGAAARRAQRHRPSHLLLDLSARTQRRRHQRAKGPPELCAARRVERGGPPRHN